MIYHLSLSDSIYLATCKASTSKPDHDAHERYVSPQQNIAEPNPMHALPQGSSTANLRDHRPASKTTQTPKVRRADYGSRIGMV